MRILFNLCGVGLGPNGGSHTIVQSANTLVELGHDVKIIDSGKCMYTWGPLKAEHTKVKNIKEIPDADVVIATGYKTFGHTLKLSKRCGKKFVWIRGWELWNAPEHKLVKVLKNPSMVKLVNSIGLQNKLNEYDIESYIIRPGNDLSLLYPVKTGHPNIIIGGLYHNKHKTKRHDWVIHTAKHLKKKFKNIQLWMFGAVSKPNIPVIDKYVYQPNRMKKISFYNGVNIWLAPSELEGLHIVPQEAMLTECAVVTTNAPLSGTQDYIIHKETGLVANNDIFSFVNQAERLVKDASLRWKLSKNGRKQIIKMGSRQFNMQKMVKLFEEQL